MCHTCVFERKMTDLFNFLQNGGHLGFFRMALEWKVLIRFEKKNYCCVCFFIMVNLNTNMAPLSQKIKMSYFWSTQQPFQTFRWLGGPSKIVLKIWKKIKCINMVNSNPKTQSQREVGFRKKGKFWSALVCLD